MNFESIMNSVISYEVLNTFCLSTTNSFDIFVEMLKANINTSMYTDNTKTRMHENLNKLPKYLSDFKSPYVVFDNLSLNETLTVLAGLDSETQKKCINQIIVNQTIIKSDDMETFYQQVSKLVRIRNCICHNDSLEILLRFLSRKYKTLRSSSDKHSYAKLIEKLSK